MPAVRVAWSRQAWRRFRKVFASRGVVEGVSINDDFANEVSDVPVLLATRRPLWVGVQEGLRTRFRQLLGVRYGVRQRCTNAATRGVAVIWDRRWCRKVGRHVDQPHRRGHGWQAIADSPDTRMRGVVWQDLVVRAKLIGRRLRVRVASAHRFPQRERAHWPKFDRALAVWILACPINLVLFMDCNEEGGPSGLMALLEEAAPGRFRWVGEGIDGCITDLPTATAEDLARRTSDHQPVSIPFDLTQEKA